MGKDDSISATGKGKEEARKMRMRQRDIVDKLGLCLGWKGQWICCVTRGREGEGGGEGRGREGRDGGREG